MKVLLGLANLTGQAKSLLDRAKSSARSAVGLEATDPVTGAKVPKADNPLQFEYAGVTYYFESQESLDRFSEEPDLFTAGGATGQAEGDIASNDRYLREEQEHVGELKEGTPAALEQPRVESGSG